MIHQDGTQLFGIPVSPVTINGVAFILEGFELSGDAARAVINDPDGGFLGAAVPTSVDFTGSAILQHATPTTPVPTVGSTFAVATSATLYPGFFAGTFVVTGVGSSMTQNAYVKSTVPVAKVKN